MMTKSWACHVLLLIGLLICLNRMCITGPTVSAAWVASQWHHPNCIGTTTMTTQSIIIRCTSTEWTMTRCFQSRSTQRQRPTWTLIRAATANDDNKDKDGDDWIVENVTSSGSTSSSSSSLSSSSSSSSQPQQTMTTTMQATIDTTALACPNCNLCDGTGRIAGGIGAVLPWIPIKAFRPCPNFLERGGEYQRRGQGLDEIAFGREKK